ncbi:MAG: helix-turn-helix domain-containing protein [Gallionella sp.]
MSVQQIGRISEENRRRNSVIFGKRPELAAINLQKGSGGADESILKLGSDILSSSTGGTIRVFNTKLMVARTATYVPRLERAIAAEDSQVIVLASVPERLVAIKAALGLNMSQLASVLKVSRQTVYNWEDGGEMQDENRARMVLLEELAELWKSLCNWTAQKYLNAPIGKTGATLLTLLSAVNLDQAEAKLAIKAVADKVNETRTRAKARGLPHNAPETGRIGMLAPYTISNPAKGDE